MPHPVESSIFYPFHWTEIQTRPFPANCKDVDSFGTDRWARSRKRNHTMRALQTWRSVHKIRRSPNHCNEDIPRQCWAPSIDEIDEIDQYNCECVLFNMQNTLPSASRTDAQILANIFRCHRCRTWAAKAMRGTCLNFYMAYSGWGF